MELVAPQSLEGEVFHLEQEELRVVRLGHTDTCDTTVLLVPVPRDFLNQALMDRMTRGRVMWDMIVAIGEPGDPELDPTVLWPKNRHEINFGTLTLTLAIPQEQAASYKINFDPLVMAEGIEPTDDPILLFRSPSYGLSYARRLRNL